mgnify:FL=1|jgi:single-strand DNA-binding protein
MSYNKTFIMGNITRDPEIRTTPGGTAVGELGLAVNRRVKDGETWREEVTFLDVTVWGKTAENCGRYLKKGRGVFVEGRLEVDEWDDQESGKKRRKMKIVGELVKFLPGAGGDRPPVSTASAMPEPGEAYRKKAGMKPAVDDGIPF